MNVCGTELKEDGLLLYSLAKIKGIGLSTSKKILEGLKFGINTMTKDVVEQAGQIEEYIRNLGISTNDALTAQVRENIRTKISIGSYEGKRHLFGLPLKGRTKSNARTVKRRRSKNA